MSILDNLYPASFRGVSFLISNSSVRGGRKTITHEFPNSNRRYVEDLGLENETLSITAHVPSTSYFTSRDSIKLALEAEGYGTLVHPFYGIRNVALTSYSINETTEDLGYVVISMDMLVAQELLFPGAVASSSLLSGQVAALFDSMKTGFFKSYEWVAKYAQNAASLTSGLNDIVSLVTSVSSTFTTRAEFDGPAVSDFTTSFNDYKKNTPKYIAKLSTSSTNIYDSTRVVIEDLSYIPNDGQQVFDIGTKLAQFKLTAPIQASTTKARTIRAANSNSLVDMMLVFAFGVTCRGIASYAVKSLNDVNTLREALDTQYEVLLNRLPIGTLSSVVFGNVQELRSATIKFLDANALTAPEVQTLAVVDMPLSVFEYSQYGEFLTYSVDPLTTEVKGRTDDLRERNRATNQDPTALNNTITYFTSK